MKFKPIETAPKDGTWIYVRFRRYLGIKKRDEVMVSKVRWMLWAPKKGGEVEQGWSEDGKRIMNLVIDAYIACGLLRWVPEAWISAEEMEAELEEPTPKKKSKKK